MFSIWIRPSLVYADQGGEWVRYDGNPILSPTPGGWDSDSVTAPRVLFDGNLFRMWYVGSHSGVTAIGYATSLDGLSWTKYPNPVLTFGPLGSFDSGQLGLGSVIQMNATFFLMYYAGSNLITFLNGAVGLATSPDGINWTKYEGNPVLKSTSIDRLILADPFVIRLENKFNMWYTGKSASDPSQLTRILFATSFDGVNWVKWPHPVFSPSVDANMWDSGSVYSPSVFYDGANFGIWYSGVNRTYVSPRIGFATSPGGVTWTRPSTNLLLDLGDSGSWDSVGVEQPCVIIGYGYMLYYDGFSSVGPSIGLARAPQGFSIPEFPIPTATLLLGITVFAVTSFLRRRRHQEGGFQFER